MKKDDLDPVRAVILARIHALGETYASISRAIGKNPSYMQQFFGRNYPRSLPEDVRELLAAKIGVSPDALRGTTPSRGGPKAAQADAIVTSAEEADLLRTFRSLPPALQSKAIKILNSLN